MPPAAANVGRRLAASAAALLAVSALVGAGLWTAWAGRPVNVNVRWRADLADAARIELEQRFRLMRPRPEGGSTWSYRLDDPRSANIEALVRHASVADTAHLNRVRFRPELSQDGERQAVGVALVVGLIAAGLAFLRLGRASGTGETRGGRTAQAWDPAKDPACAPAPEGAGTTRWFWGVLLVMAPLVISLCQGLWRTPFPIGETVALLEDVEKAQAGSVWRLFDPEARSWYRPLFHYTFYLTWGGTDQVDQSFDRFRILEVAALLGLVILFTRALRPKSLVQAAAAACSLAALLGMPGLRDNLEVPMLMTLVGMPLGLAVWAIAERPSAWWHTGAVVLLLLVAVGYKEQGLVIAPLVVTAWWMGAPGVSGRTAAAAVGATMAYLAVRFTHTGGWPVFEQDLGLGFGEISAGEAVRRYGTWPWGMYAYNALATGANILFSEPTRGRFAMTAHLSAGTWAPWEVVQAFSSLASTALVVWWGVAVTRRDRIARQWTSESRLCTAVVVSTAASAALGFMYARDRLGGMAAVFLAAALYFALLLAVDRAARSRRVGLAALGVGALALSWQLRAVGTLEALRAQAESSQREWIVSIDGLRREFAARPRYIAILEAMIEQGRSLEAPRRTPYPDAVRAWLGEP